MEMERSRSSSERQGVLNELLHNMNAFLTQSTAYFPPFVACVQVRPSTSSFSQCVTLIWLYILTSNSQIFISV